MDWKLFKELSDAKSALLDVCLMILVISYSYTKYMTFDFINGMLGFIAVVIFHLIINFHNNFNDYRAGRTNILQKRLTNISVNRETISHVKRFPFLLGIIPLLILAYLVYSSGWVILVIAILGVALGMLYTSGPKPLNQTVIGEITMAVATTVVVPVAFGYLGLASSHNVDSSTIIDIIVISLPNTFAVFAAIIAANLAGLIEDPTSKQSTLAERIGQHDSLNLFKASWAVAFLLVPVLAITQETSYLVLILILFYPGIWDKFRPFLKEPRASNFEPVLKATIRLAVSYVGLFVAGSLLHIVLKLIK